MSLFTQAQVDALTAAIAQGVTEVEHNGKRVRYASIEAMLRLRDRMLTELRRFSDAPPRPLAHRSVYLKQ